MNFKYRWLMILTVFTSYAWGDKSLICDSDTNICSVAVSENFCGAEGNPRTKWGIRSQSYILSCECDCTAQENSFWISEKNGEIKALEASKVVSGLDISRNKYGIPDILGIVPYCQAVPTNNKNLIYLRKGPSNFGEKNPYCYSILEDNEAQPCTSSNCLEKQKLVLDITQKLKHETLIEFKNATSSLYKDSSLFLDFPKRDFVENYIQLYGYSRASQQHFNDIAYFWQQAGFNEYAIWLLNKVISENPRRAVAYLNLADSYWAVGDKVSAAKNYQTYDTLMTTNRKQNKIPERVKQRVMLQ